MDVGRGQRRYPTGPGHPSPGDAHREWLRNHVVPEVPPIPRGALDGELGVASWPRCVTREERRAFEAMGRYVPLRQETKRESSDHGAAQQQSINRMTLACRPRPAQLKRKREPDEVEVDRNDTQIKKQKAEPKSQSDTEKLLSEAWTAALLHADAILLLVEVDDTGGGYKRFIAKWLAEHEWAAELDKIKQAYLQAREESGVALAGPLHALLDHLERAWKVIDDATEDHPTMWTDDPDVEELKYLKGLVKHSHWVKLAYDFGPERNQMVLAHGNYCAARDTKHLLLTKDYRAQTIERLSALPDGLPTERDAAPESRSRKGWDEHDEFDEVRYFDDKKVAVDEIRKWIIWKEKFMIASAEQGSDTGKLDRGALVEARLALRNSILPSWKRGSKVRATLSVVLLC
ncbi:uncharacterized protein CLAFUR5_03270 [Fulvia fulva]|uniref:Uncharacterized protein n=1 Tax=Passalora fulva TaxID=5499 RepID=A0A9Q8L9Y5_PASFU|nr:uncharacterized protein CLAFUR5_03270 [Fulvia fulva]KAK4632985.1 hypothetical protein CLAFUR0_03282 [Fulvia fulva]UJO13578.1 hypothetical protein CLAFUR5_03270 [Fulvia fulva]